MKKYTTTVEFRKFNKKRSLIKIAHNNKRKNKLHFPRPSQEVIDRKNKNKKAHYEDVIAPSVFSLIQNTREIMNFISEMKDYIDRGKPVFIRMKTVTSVTLDAIIYTIAFFENLREQGIGYTVDGDFPTDPVSKKLIQESGFLLYIYPHAKLNIKTDILTIKDGYMVDSEVAKKVSTYVRDWLFEDRENTKPIFNILIESMANTHNHAFSNSKTTSNKWYLVAFHTNDEVHFVFFDNGMGIAKTINRKWIKDIAKDDSELILSALKGTEFRSQTGEKKRGKGLPKIYKHAQENNIKELIIIANKGLVSCKNDIRTTLDKEFKGTLISWKIVKKNNKE